MSFLPPDIAARVAADLTRSALPDAPQRPHVLRRRGVVRAQVGQLLRATAKRLTSVADRLDRRYEPSV